MSNIKTNTDNQLLINTSNPVPVKDTNNGFNVFSYLFSIYIVFFIIVWLVSGFAAWIASFICLGFNGSISDKLIGILIVFLLGPIYWLYFSLNKTYCTRSTQNQEF